MAISSDEQTIVSGAADSMVTFWKDCTTEIDSENEIKRTELVLKYAPHISSCTKSLITFQGAGFGELPIAKRL